MGSNDSNGVITANLPETLVYARTGNGMAAGVLALNTKSEFAAQVNFIKLVT
jgi:hypothetical protein